MRSPKWIGYALLIIGLPLAVISAFVPLPADRSSSAAADTARPFTWRSPAPSPTP